MTKASPYRYAVSVSDPFNLIDSFFNDKIVATMTNTADTYPPHNVIELDADTRVVEFAVAGFDRQELSVSQDKRKLVVSAEKKKDEKEVKYLHRGIAQRKFHKEYPLWEYWNVSHVDLNNGILYVVIKREVPEDKKPKVFEIL